MGVVEWDEGHTTYSVRGLRTRGWELMSLAAGLREQVEVRSVAANAVLADLGGPYATEVRTQAMLVSAALVDLVHRIELAGSTCLNFPNLGRATHLAPPPLDQPPGSTAVLSADVAALRSLSASTGAWDAQVRHAGHAVDLHGVTATAVSRRYTPSPSGGPPVEHVEPTVTLDPATLVHLPSAADATATVLTRSSALADLSLLLARAVEDADGLGGLMVRVRLTALVLELKRSRGTPPDQYAEHLQEYWLARAYERAGIDPSQWVPSAGATANRQNIEAVYRYYGNLFLENGELQWAGMANMIGPSFAAGFLDLAMFREFAGLGSVPADIWRDLPIPLPASGELQLLDGLANLTTAEIRYYETTLLQMQKDIFVDAAVMHEAYLVGGMPAIRELRSAGLINTDAATAWSLIAAGARTGDPAKVARGNEMLLDREQNITIRDAYNDMYTRFPTGPAVTYAMTLVGQPSIPGAKGYPDVYPLELRAPLVPVDVTISTPRRIGTPESFFGRDIWSIGVDLPSVKISVPQTDVVLSTPLADGNIADQGDRWRLIQEDTLPAYEKLLADDPERVREIIDSPIGDRIEEYRLANRLDEIVHHLATDWDVRLDSSDR